jgi:hypothetical protein
MGGGRVLETGVFTWLNFPPAALDQCRHPCVWLQDAESLHEVDAAVHYCGETSPRPAVMASEAASVYLCAQQVLPYDCRNSPCVWRFSALRDGCPDLILGAQP